MSNRSKDRSDLCSFTFVDGRRCRIPRRPDHPYLCAFPTCSGGSSAPPARWPRAPLSPIRQLRVRLRSVKPKTASTLAYLGQTLVQILPLAQDEYINAYDTDTWRETIRTSHEQSADHMSPDPPSPPAPERDPDAPPAPHLPRRPQTHLLPLNWLEKYPLLTALESTLPKAYQNKGLQR